MANGKSPAIGTELNIPTYLPLRRAAQKYGLSEKALTQLVQAGKIEAVRLPSGEVLVPAKINGDEPQTKEQIKAKKFADLQEQPITVSEAASIYQLHERTIRRWIENGYIRVIDENAPIQVDQADVAYCKEIYRKYGGKRGVRIFDEDGSPYELKHPKLAQYRRRKQKENRSE